MSNSLLPTTNADGLPIVPMSEEQKYRFDLKGWVCLPGLLSEEELIPVREHQMKFLYERDSCSLMNATITAAHRKSYSTTRLWSAY